MEVPSSLPSSSSESLPVVELLAPPISTRGQQNSSISTRTLIPSSQDLDYDGCEADVFQSIDDPCSLDSTFDKLHKTFIQIASAHHPVQVAHQAAGFVRALLLTAIVQDDASVILEPDFTELCCIANDVTDAAWIPELDPCSNTQTHAFIVNAPSFVEHWLQVGKFQLLRARLVECCASIANAHEWDMREQTCRMYDPDAMDEVDGLRSVLRFLDASEDFVAKDYINARFGDIISYRKLPYVDYSNDKSEGTPPCAQRSPPSN